MGPVGGGISLWVGEPENEKEKRGGGKTNHKHHAQIPRGDV